MKKQWFMRCIAEVAVLLAALTLAGCGGKAKRTDTTSSGMAVLAADATFSDVMQQEVDVFEVAYPKASLYPIFTDEGNALALLMSDSVRMAVVARDFTEDEKLYIKGMNEQLIPRSCKIAEDGVALIVHRDNPDTLMSLATLRRIMTGEITSWQEVGRNDGQGEIGVVFDLLNSSTARFIRDSICGGDKLYGGLRSLRGSREVLEWVENNPSALGVIGVGWISNPHDSLHLSFSDRIRVVSLSRTHPATPADSYKPYPAYLHLRKYPLTRDIYVLLTDLRGTLPSGFTNFIAGERGQRIILKAGLVPATMPLRTVVTRDEL